jgi:hypothetical protein
MVCNKNVIIPMKKFPEVEHIIRITEKFLISVEPDFELTELAYLCNAYNRYPIEPSSGFIKTFSQKMDLYLKDKQNMIEAHILPVEHYR